VDRTEEKCKAESSRKTGCNGDILELSCEKVDWSNHGGSRRKKTLKTGDIIYMVKFPDRYKNAEGCLNYRNNQFSEYVGCHIYESLGRIYRTCR
jgi:hypothetical protein